MRRSCLPKLVFQDISKNCGRGYDLGTATGLQTVVYGKQWHLPVKHPSPNILMAINYCGHQLAQNLGSLRGKGGAVCEELRNRMIDVRCLQEVRWRRHGARMMGMKGRRHKL